MADLKIRIYKGDTTEPETTVTVPGTVMKIARRFIPDEAVDALEEQGIDLDELIRLSQEDDAAGTLAEVESHRKGERVVISLE